MNKSIKKARRVVVYVKDIQLITGRRKGAARNLYRTILRSLGKRPGQFITFQEFSLYTGIDEEMIQEYLQS